MLRHSLAGLIVVLAMSSLVLADETRGTIVKIDGDKITVQPIGGGFGKTKEKVEPKTFTIAKEAKVLRSMGKDKDDVKLSMDDLKTALKVTAVFVTITHEGDSCTEIKTGGGGFGGGKGGKGGKDKKKKDE